MKQFENVIIGAVDTLPIVNAEISIRIAMIKITQESNSHAHDSFIPLKHSVKPNT